MLKPLVEPTDSASLSASTGIEPYRTSRFLSELTVEHGPAGLLGRFFLRADQAVHERGVTLRFASFEEMAEINQQNRSSWPQLMPLLDYRECRITPETGLCVLGQDRTGEVVTAQAARLIDLGEASLREAAENLEFFYPDKAPNDRNNFQSSLNAPSADEISGRIVYSGGTWVRPDYRSRGMASMLPRLSRAIAATRWNAPITISFVTDDLIRRGVPKAYGYTNVEWGLELTRGGEPVYSGALIWMSQSELYVDMDFFLSMSDAQVDPKVWNRTA